jgi:hypothetical protein
MQTATLHEVEEALLAIDPDTLREMAHSVAQSHVIACELTSRQGDCSHITDEETRGRIDNLDPAQLVALLAPTAWIPIVNRVQPRR